MSEFEFRSREELEDVKNKVSLFQTVVKAIRDVSLLALVLSLFD